MAEVEYLYDWAVDRVEKGRYVVLMPAVDEDGGRRLIGLSKKLDRDQQRTVRSARPELRIAFMYGALLGLRAQARRDGWRLIA